MQKEYVWGTEGRGDDGCGLSQLAFASKADLTAAIFEAAHTAMAELKGDEGRQLTIKPMHTARKITFDAIGPKGQRFLFVLPDCHFLA